MLQSVLNILFPKTCVNCGMIGSYFCNDCRSKIGRVKSTICPMCNKPSPYGYTHPKCKTRYSLEGLTSIYRYTGSIQKAIKKIKYRRIKNIASELSQLVSHEISKNDYPSFAKFIKNKPVIIPIPLHKSRERKRWFNQSEIIGNELAVLWRLECNPNMLKRVRSTKSQAGLLKKDRVKNIKGAFRVNTKVKVQMLNDSAILVDDVWTTGATMREAGNVLKRNGVKSIWAFTVAR